MLYHRVSPRIISVHAKLPLLIPAEPASLGDLRRRMGKDLQYPDKDLCSTRNWVLMEDWESTIKTDAGVFVRKARKGWTTDFGSIPSWVEFYIKRDDRRMLVGFLNHDIDFGTGCLSLEWSGCQLHQTAAYFGVDALRNWFIWRAVTGKIAGNIYDGSDVDYEKQWSRGEWNHKG